MRQLVLAFLAYVFAGLSAPSAHAAALVNATAGFIRKA
jgi:hypothetical protein